MVFTTMVRASSKDSPRRIAQANMPKVPITIRAETSPTRQSTKPETRGAFAARGGRRIESGSAGSKASASPSVTAVTMLIHRIWTGVIGRVSPRRIAMMIANASPMLVGRDQAITFCRLS